MINIDSSTAFGKRVQERLQNDVVGWLVTVDDNGSPQPSLVWFLWDGESILVYSQPEKPKLRNIARSPSVSFHLDSDGQGGDVVVLTGSAIIDSASLPASGVPEYLAKYQGHIAQIGMTPESFAVSYSVPIRVTPQRL